MNQDSIINYLKFNKKLGVAFAFMPKPVQKWAKENSRELCCYNQPIESTEYKWLRDGTYKQINQDGLYALPEDFKNSQNNWVEFGIDVDGFFQPSTDTQYRWFDWCSFLRTHPEYDSFGGWQYDKGSEWFMYPLVFIDDYGYNNVSCNSEKNKTKGVVPIKIRFWKGE